MLMSDGPPRLFGTMTRRHWLGHLAATAMGVPAVQFFSALQANARALRKSNRSMIVLWMGGGPSHMDIWDLKPDGDSSKFGGPFKPIDTTAPGVKICEHMPRVAKQMRHLSVLRSLNSKEGNHDRGRYVMHTGYVPNPTVVHPGFGSYCALELGERLENFDLPHCIAINGPGAEAGFLGMSYSPFVVQNPNAPIANLKPPKDVEQWRMERRLRMLGQVENQFVQTRRSQSAVDHKSVYSKTLRMMNSRYQDAFNLKSEPDAVRDAYGRGSFGSGCLMARRLVEQGVTYVEVSLGGWDTHANNFDTLKDRLLPELDKGMGSLVEDLAARRLLDTTTIVWMGEFGRTPRINQNSGRDHWPNGWSVVVGGGGMKNGQAIGATDKNGVDVVDQPISVMDMIATLTKSMGMKLDQQYTTPLGRPIKIVDGGKPIPQLFG